MNKLLHRLAMLFLIATFHTQVFATDAPANLITVTTTTGGELGDKILAQVSTLAEVRSLKIIGPINATDYSNTMKGLVRLTYLDMSQAETEAIPDYQFCSWSNYWKNDSLQTLLLPSNGTLKKIGRAAFAYQKLQTMTIPGSVNEILRETFERCQNLTKVIIEEGVPYLSINMFYNCIKLQEAILPASVKEIKENSFNYCTSLTTIDLSHVINIGYLALYNTSIEAVNLCADLYHIGDYAFQSSKLRSFVMPDRVTELGAYVLYNCDSLRTVTIGASVSNLNALLNSSDNVETIVCKAPTPPSWSDNNDIHSKIVSKATLVVPGFAMNTYKQATYWNLFNTWNTYDGAYDFVNVAGELNMDNASRITGTPNINVVGTLTMSGNAPQSFNNFGLEYNLWKSNDNNNAYSNFINNSTAVTAQSASIKIADMDNNWWYFFTPPFDMQVNDINFSDDALHVVRYYDGAARALSTATNGFWKDVPNGATLYSGKGYIIRESVSQADMTATTTNTTELFSINDKVVNLEANISAYAANQGWNLIGNPWPCHFDVSKIEGFSSPITVWQRSNNSYKAISLVDDGYVLRPLEAFFVQCPEGTTSITFPAFGRQNTNVISASAKKLKKSNNNRKLINISLTDGNFTDDARIVINSEASTDYELTCDAAKFATMNNDVPQVFSIEDATRMAINERPTGNGKVLLGFTAPTEGSFVINSNRNDISALIVDTYTNTETLLDANGYTFSSKAGTFMDRFILKLSNQATGITTVESSQSDKLMEMYNLAGQRVNDAYQGVVIKNGKKVMRKK